MAIGDELAIVTIEVARQMKKNPRKRNILLIISAIILGSSLIAMNSHIDFFYYNNVRVILLFVVIGSMAVFLPSVFSFILPSDIEENKKIAKLQTERVELEKKTETEPTIFDLIRLNLNRLDEYYTLNIIQAKNSYRLSASSVVAGFGAIIFTVVYLLNSDGFDVIAIVSAVTGIVTEFIGATAIVLYRESIKSVNSFHTKLSQLQDIMIAIELTEKLDGKAREEAISGIIKSIMSEVF